MIKFLLQEIEKSPHPIFSKRELLCISPKDFHELCISKILFYLRPSENDMEKLRMPRCQYGCPLTVVQTEDGLEAVCLEHPEEDPIPIERDDLNRYALSLDRFLFQLRTVNAIEGSLHRISGGYFYLGYKTYNDHRVGFIFIPRIGKELLVKLSGLRHLCEDDDILIVVNFNRKVHHISLQKCTTVPKKNNSI